MPSPRSDRPAGARRSTNTHVGRPRRFPRSAAFALALVIGFVVPLVVEMPEARAVTPTIILGRSQVGEFQGVVGDGFIAWQQNSREHPNHYDVFARSQDGGRAFKVNADGTNGAIGGIDNGILLYQQFRGGDSDLKLYDLNDRVRSSPPRGVNSAQWEYWPSISGSRLLFGRLSGNDLRRVILFDVTTGDATVLAKIKRGNGFLQPGQVNGDYAVWSRCVSSSECSVVEYRISDGSETMVPNHGRRDHAPSVTPDGIVYFARSGGNCGNGTRISRFVPGGDVTSLWRLPNGDDVGTTRVDDEPEGTTVLYDHFACGSAVESDVWQFVEQGPNQLFVSVQGDGSGTVTSSPAGITCGSDCTEIYPPGTGVTLTATPQGDVTFAGWSGACTGSATTCSLTIDGPRSVIATFTTKPVLTVSKDGGGDGLVSSSPSGINCGTDCNQPYNQGTTVTLTATPDATSTFAGWGGACSGTGSCTVTMNASQLVTATFNGVPQQLSVTVQGTGSGLVTSTPAGISCSSGSCQASFDPGTMVTLTASAGNSSTFVGWGDDCSGAAGCSVTMDGPRSVTATFDAVPQTLSVSFAGSGSGAVTGVGIDCSSTGNPNDCTEDYPPGTQVTLSAAADSGTSEFGGWSGGGCSGTGSCMVTMDASQSVIATFNLLPP